MKGVAPLENVLVLDLTRAVAGPFCTMLLGDLGARVIKIEEPRAGDETRNWGPPFLDGWSTYFLSMNRNKESVAVDLKSPEGRGLIEAIARKADVVIENFKPGVAERLGIGAEALCALNPRLIYASVSGFGQTGEQAQRPGYDIILQAVSGSMHASAPEGVDAVKVAFPVADILAALFTGQAILAALYAREKSGQGRRIDVSLFQGMLCAMSNLATATLNTGNDPRRVGVAQPNIVPYQLFPTEDKPLIVGAPNERLWRRFCLALGQRDWADDPRFADNRLRNENRDVLVALIKGVLRQRPAAYWQERFDEHEVPCGQVVPLSEALRHPHAGVLTVNHEQLGQVSFPENPMRLSEHEHRASPPQPLGKDTAAVTAEFLAIM
jgi:formyl-CoA transferase/CoA:oxalate CoA-transferase